MMGYESKLFNLLSDLVAGRVYADVTPDVPVFPLIVWEQPSGRAYAYMENKLPDHKHARIQISCVANTRLLANDMARQVERRMVEGGVFSTVEAYGAFQTGYIEPLKMYEARQDFGVWYPDP